MSEIPVHSHPRRLSDWLNPAEAKKVHSLIDKVYQRRNLEIAWERVKANRGSGGVDGMSIADFAQRCTRIRVRNRSSGSWIKCVGLPRDAYHARHGN